MTVTLFPYTTLFRSEQGRERERLNAELMASLVHALTEPDPDGGGAVVPTSFTDDSPTYTTPEAGNGHAGTTPETKSVRATFPADPENRAAPESAPGEIGRAHV